MAQFNRERVPERSARQGRGAFGQFEVTGDVAATPRRQFQPGEADRDAGPVLDRRRGAGQPGHLARPARIRAEVLHPDGNYDLVGNNTPVFFVKDPIKFQDFIRSQKRRAGNGLRDNDMQWDFWTLSPESAHQVTWLMGDRGIPKSYRHMNGYGSHTYRWINAAGERVWVKYHFKTNQGVEF